jgi:hypothetical protein
LLDADFVFAPLYITPAKPKALGDSHTYDGAPQDGSVYRTAKMETRMSLPEMETQSFTRFLN